MASTIDDLQIKFSADISALNKSISQVSSQFQSLERKVDKTSTHMSGAFKSASSAATMLKTAVAAVAFGAAARGAIEMADAMTSMQSRIRLVVGATGDAVGTQQKLLDVANRTRSGFEAVGALYARVGRSADALGLSQERLIAFTETFSQALKISGASTAETESTILQLSQALASGRLQGAELNAVLESGGRAATALADGLGVPIGSLKKLGEQGVLTAQVVIQAIESQAGVIKSEFQGMQVTVGDAFTVLRNSVAETIGKVNDGTGATKGLAQEILYLAETLKDPQLIAGLAEIAGGVVAIGSAATKTAAFIGNVIANIRTLGFAKEEALALEGKSNEHKASVAKHGTHNVDLGIYGKPKESASKPAFDPNAGKKDKEAAAAERDARQYADALSDLTFQLDQLSRSEEAAAYQEALRNNLQRAGVAANSAEGAQIAELTGQIEAQIKVKQALAEVDEAAAEAGQKWADMKQAAGDAVASAFERAIVEGESLREVFAGLLQDLARMIFQKMVFNAISDAVVGGFASGGGINAGNAYVVGERGPELFVPKVPGTVVPNKNIGSGSGMTITSVVNAAPGVNRAELQGLLDQRDRSLAARLPRIMIDKQRRNALGGAFG